MLEVCKIIGWKYVWMPLSIRNGFKGDFKGRHIDFK